jgi:ferritin-like protein
MTEPTLGDIDADGAVTEAIAAVEGASRAELLRGAAVGAITLLLADVAPAAAASGKEQDVAILNYALSLEYLQADFYTEVERMQVLHGALEHQATVVGAHERAHVAAFKQTLGRAAIKKPRFDFRGATEQPAAFRRTAVAFEDLAVAAYKGQAPRLSSPAFLTSALAVHTVEARHAAWIRRLAGAAPAATAFDEPRSRASTERLVRATHFEVETSSRRSPGFTG